MLAQLNKNQIVNSKSRNISTTLIVEFEYLLSLHIPLLPWFAVSWCSLSKLSPLGLYRLYRTDPILVILPSIHQWLSFWMPLPSMLEQYQHLRFSRNFIYQHWGLMKGKEIWLTLGLWRTGKNVSTWSMQTVIKMTKTRGPRLTMVSYRMIAGQGMDRI